MTCAELTQLALLGTERQTPSPVAPGSPLGDLLAQLDPAAREQFVLSAAALAVQHERAGLLAPHEAGPSPEPCRPEPCRRVSQRAGQHLAGLLGGEYAELLPEWLGLAARTQQIAPPQALPALLALGVSKPDLRENILPVLGERGRWLAAQNPVWSWPGGAADDEGIWHTGECAARLLFLQRLRRANPSRARELLISTWKEETPDERAIFAQALAIGLGSEDEPFLEAALDDKRKEVRRAAATLLARLPGSALVLRMTGRAQPLLKFTAGQAGALLRLKKSKKPVIEVVLPAECDKAMQRDGIEPKPPSGLGEKASWLIQMLEVVPLQTWTAAWNCSPAEVLGASSEGEWKQEFFLAWSRAAIRQQAADWAGPLLQTALETEQLNLLEPLLAALTPERREARLAEILKAGAAKIKELRGLLILQCRHDWSVTFSRGVLLWLRRLTSQASPDWSLRNQLKELAPYFAPETLNEIATGWPTDSAAWEFWSKGVDELIATAQFRHDMREELLRQE